MAESIKKSPPWLKLYAERKYLFKLLDGESVKTVIVATLDYLETGTTPSDLSESEQVVFELLQKDADEAANLYNQRINAKKDKTKTDRVSTDNRPIIDRVSTDGELELEIEQEQELDLEREREREKERGTPPTLSDVKNYCTEKGLTISAEKFFTHYQSTGWKAGKNPITDWKAKANEWASEDKERAKTAPATKTNRFQTSERADYGDIAKLERILLGEE